MYSLSGSEKFIPAAFVVIERNKPPEELLPEPAENVSVRNVYFDTTPLDLVTGVISEAGIHPISELRTMLSSLETNFVIRPEHLGPPFAPPEV